MFGFSLQKLLVLLAVIGAVWYGFKLIGRLDAHRKAETKLRGETRPRRGGFWRARAAPTSTSQDLAEDMVQCPVCKAYVAARGVTSCGRGDCPY